MGENIFYLKNINWQVGKLTVGILLSTEIISFNASSSFKCTLPYVYCFSFGLIEVFLPVNICSQNVNDNASANKSG